MLTLANTQAASLAVSVDGQEGCTVTSLPAASTFNCTIRQQVSQQDFDAWDIAQQALGVAVTATAVAQGHADRRNLTNSTSIDIDLQATQSLALTQTSAEPSSITTAGKPCRLTPVGQSVRTP